MTALVRLEGDTLHVTPAQFMAMQNILYTAAALGGCPLQASVDALVAVGLTQTEALCRRGRVTRIVVDDDREE